MGRSLSPLLADLDNADAESRRSAMEALRSYAKQIDAKSLPSFLAEVSDGTGGSPATPSGEFTISLYEVLARFHGRSIVPQIGRIMSTIMSTLSSAGGSFALHQACARVVPAIARYGIDAATPDDEKSATVAALCRPLCAALLAGKNEAAASGAALCLTALVESANWKFAGGELVNEVCLKLAGAMQDGATQSNAHMALAMALVKHNGLVAEAYAPSLIRSGLLVVAAGNSQKRLSAIQMINFLMKSVDPRSIWSELESVSEAMDRRQSDDRMPFVRGAAFEALQTARSILAQRGAPGRMKSPSSSSPWEGSGSNCRESHVVDASIAASPESVGQSSCNLGSVRRSARRLWSDSGNVDVSLKDGFFLRACSGGKALNRAFDQECSGADSFSGFTSAGIASATTWDSTESPKASRRQTSFDDIKICSTPRRLVRSLQGAAAAMEDEASGDPADASSCIPDTEPEDDEADSSPEFFDCSSEEPRDGGPCVELAGKLSEDGEEESVSSTGCGVSECTTCSDDASDPSSQLAAVPAMGRGVGKKWRATALAVAFAVVLIALAAAVLPAILGGDGGEFEFEMVPT